MQRRVLLRLTTSCRETTAHFLLARDGMPVPALARPSAPSSSPFWAPRALPKTKAERRKQSGCGQPRRWLGERDNKPSSKLSPAGTAELSPRTQSWVGMRRGKVPQGRLEGFRDMVLVSEEPGRVLRCAS